MHFKLIISMVKTQDTDKIVDAVKDAGAKGATIIPARGTGIHEAKTFFGLSLEAQTDVVLVLLKEQLVEQVLEAIDGTARFGEPGKGIAFVVDVEKAIGMSSQIGHLEKPAG